MSRSDLLRHHERDAESNWPAAAVSPQTVRTGTELVAASHAYAKLRRPRGKVVGRLGRAFRLPLASASWSNAIGNGPFSDSPGIDRTFVGSFFLRKRRYAYWAGCNLKVS
jgi:hypothetical protein